MSSANSGLKLAVHKKIEVQKWPDAHQVADSKREEDLQRQRQAVDGEHCSYSLGKVFGKASKMLNSAIKNV